MHSLLLHFPWGQLLKPKFYIDLGGLYLLLFIIFAETGLFFGFFLPGDSLLFVAGIYSKDLVLKLVDTHSPVLDLGILWILFSIMGILGNWVGFWFGWKSGAFLYERKDTWFFKKEHLAKAHDFYEKYGGAAIVYARFLPIIRTFAPIVAGIVRMDRRKFIVFNIVGCLAWVFIMLVGGHYLQEIILAKTGFDLKEHLEVVVLVIVIITTAPVLLKLFFGKKKTTNG